MHLNEISGQRQLAFMQQFDYIREAGTEGELRAAAALCDTLASFGAEGRIEEFPFEGYRTVRAEFTVTEPFCRSYTVTAVARCGSTPGEGVEAPFLYAENGDDISLSFARGKLVMVNSITPDLYRRLVAAGAVGFLTVAGSPIDEGEDRIPPARGIRAPETPIQGAVIHMLDAMELVEAGASRARLCVTQESYTATSRNVIATVPGSDLADEILTLTAHYDSVPAGPGAYDNMAGCAIIMELCRYFHVHRPRRTVEFVWFGAEEKGLVGSRQYVLSRLEQLPRHKFNMNVDLAGQLVGGTVVGVTGDPSICTMIEYMAYEIGLGMTTRNAVWGSDSNCFAWKGVPAMTLNRDGFGMHTRHDTLQWISPWSLCRSAQLLGHIASSLAQIPVMPFKRDIPEAFARDLARFLG